MLLRSRSGVRAAGERACRPGSVHPLARAGGHPSGTAVAGSLVRSTREHRAGRPQALAQETRPVGRDSLLTLLRVGFTEPPGSLRALVVSYTTVSPLPPNESGGGLFSVALSRGSPRVGVTDHPALLSPDLPRRRPEASQRRGRPACSPAAAFRIGRYGPGCRRCAVSLSDRSTAGPSEYQTISHKEATSRLIRNSAADGASIARQASVLIGVTWLTSNNVRDS